MWDFIFSLWCALFGTCADESGCRNLTHADVEHTVCTYSTADISLRLYSLDKNGKPYKKLRRLEASLKTEPVLLMNGGMYHDDLAPVGLYIEQGDKIKGVSTKGGWGNFHLLPNGIFWVSKDAVGVTETKRFLKAGIRATFATQSGPMLVINGALHPRFLKKSDSRKIRNGVGLSRDRKTIHFVISHEGINFWNFADLFKTELKSHNALFLDGTVSAIRAPGFSRGGYWHDLGPMIGVFKK